MAEAPAFTAQPRAEPPCVALQSSECRAAPSRPCQYSLVPEAYRLEHGLNANAGICSSNHCKRFVKALPPVGQPGRRGPSKKRRKDEETLPDAPLRGPSPSHRQQPRFVIEVFEMKAVRRTAVDCERQTTDEAVHAARRNALPQTSAPNEFQVHGTFKMAAEEREFPDTYIFTVAQLHDAGLSKTVIMAKLQAFQQQLQLECQQELQELQEPEEAAERGPGIRE